MQSASAFVPVSLALEQPCSEKNAIMWLSASQQGQQHPQLGKIQGVSLLSTNMKTPHLANPLSQHTIQERELYLGATKCSSFSF